MDYSKLSDSQLLAMHSGDYSKLSDGELKSLAGGGASAPAPEAPSMLESLARGGAEGASLGFRGEAQGLLADPGMGDKYREARDSEDHLRDAAKAAHPWAYGAAQIAGGIVPSMVAAPLAGAAKVATGIGALMGLGHSNADLTKGEVGRAAVDTAVGGATGYGLSKVGSFIANKFAPKAPFEIPLAKRADTAFDPANPPAPYQSPNPDAPFLSINAKTIFDGRPKGAAPMPAPAAAIPESAAPAAAGGMNLWKAGGGTVGGHLGGMIPIPGARYAGTKLGEAAGEKLGNAITGGQGLDKIQEMLRSAPEAFGRWAPALIQAANRGGNALAVQHFLLMQQDSGYRQQVAGQK